MHIYKTFFVIFFVVLFAASLSYAKDVRIAVVDVEKILSDSKAGKSIEAQLTARREKFQKEFSKRENDLVESEKKLVEKKKKMPAEEFSVKRQAFEKKLLETRNLFQKSRNSLDQGLGQALSKLRSNILEVTSEIADEEDYNVVLTRDSVVIVEKEMDITPQVLKRMDSKFSSIKLHVKE